MEYRHGGDVYRNRQVELDFSININPLGMPEAVRQEALAGVLESARYPDSRCGRLKTLTADYYQVPEDCLIFGNGAAELIFGIARAAAAKKAVLLAPSFTEYEAALKCTGTDCRFFYLKEKEGFRLPVEEYLEFLEKEAPQLIFLCNPSNPVGTVTEREDMKKILDFCGDRGIFVVVDECFLDFLENGKALSVADEAANGNEGLFVLRAMTKIFAMAGLRLGYGFLGNRKLKESMESSIQPWNVSIPAQYAGCAAFGDWRNHYLSATRELLKSQREYLGRGLLEAGFSLFDSRANFLFFKDSEKREERALYQYFLEQKILIRCCDDFRGLNGRFYRICLKRQEDNERFLGTLQGYLNKKTNLLLQKPFKADIL